MTTETRPRRPARDRDHRATVVAALLLTASAATLAYVLLGGPHEPVELPADEPPNAVRS
ncbi:hypothetical protein [Streptomyces sp. NPDC054786]